jgi:hypothetical protein
MLNNFFLLNFNENLESYIFDLIQSIKISKFNLLIKNMIIILIDHDKRINNNEDSDFKSLVIKFNNKSSKF